ncbi:MAG: Fe-S cluster assembly transcriptional regulator IscR [Porticoccaceae bacterium]|jgi:Rrf2 family iron-sulfur cluster assembly transcriptional regulator|nr:Fe-S cluster assembly transcriptional regulator IscR [Porticoccaceae bacterium]MBT4163732.1 Fe-S cluster assembly transcriptional regulator IscR [Porticoccaceae bacterium]MBT4590614.1 Fe-S cluster assembly transcriptional regulator IscR [Porticoccaceae bacterium]MBT5004950.1 Fe-S cluster assembly transcriptional regulator IscR [Porticoccaceae bacterium]MBT5102763.1 Fe-S cluster assembly transcriptional regulator IscR [Porticoccaceae bacterium]
MRLTTRGRYAVTAMLDLALHSENRPVSLAEISERQTISLSYLEQLFSRLRKAGLVDSVRGPGGGYLLVGQTELVCVADIIKAVNESVDSTNCGGRGDCQGGSICLTHNLWDDLSRQINDFLSGISLADLVAKRDVQTIAHRQVDQLLTLEDNNVRANAC